MTEQRPLINLFSSGPSPTLTDDVIDEIEDFLLYAVDSEVSIHIYNLVQFFQLHLSTFIRSTSLTYASQHYQKRLLRAMRFFRHSSLNYMLSKQLEDIAFAYLMMSPMNQQICYSRQQAYVFLIDHFIAAPHGIPDRCQELIEWSIKFVNSALQNIAMIDPNLYLTVIISLPSLITLFPESINVPQFIDVLINIAIVGLNLIRQSNQFDSFEIIIVKSLRLCAGLITKYRTISNDTVSFVLRLEDFQSDTIQYAKIFQNYLMVACAIMQLESYPAEEILAKKIIPPLVNYFPFFIHMPLLQNKRISFYLKTVAIWVNKNKQKVSPSLLPKLWNILSCFHGQMAAITSVGEIIKKFISPDVLHENPLFHLSLLENLISSLEIIKLDLDSIDLSKSGRPFEADLLLECNRQIMSLITQLVQMDSTMMQQATPHSYTLKVNLYVRLVRYVCYLLDLAGSIGSQNDGEFSLSSVILHQIHLKEFREKMSKIFDFFVVILASLHPTLFHEIMTITMLDFLPRQIHRNFHKYVIGQIITKCPHLYDFQAIFFATLADHFDNLMLPTPPSVLLEITRIVYKSAFADDGQSGQQQQQQQQQQVGMCADLYRFIIQAIVSNNSMIFELLLTMFHSYFQHKSNRYEPLIKIISSSPFLMNNVLQTLIDDPTMRDVVSLLSLFLFPLCNVQQQLVESWVQLFLPAIESQSKISTAIPTLYNYTSRSFAQWTAGLKEPIQSNFVAALMGPLSRLSPREQNLRILLGKIPDIACRLSLQTTGSKKKNSYVLVGGFKVSAEIVFEAIKRNQNPSENDISNLFECYCQHVAKLRFFEAVNDQLVLQMTEYIQKRNPNLLENMYMKFSPPTQYAALFLRQKYGKPIDEVMVDDANDLLQHVATLCFSKSTAESALHIISLYLDCVDEPNLISRLNISLLHAAQFNQEQSFKIISEQILTRDFTDYPDLQKEISGHYLTANMVTLTNIRRTAIKSMAIMERKYGIKNSIDGSRQALFKDIVQMLQKETPCVRFEFVFAKPFTDCQDPIALMKNLLEFLKSRPPAVISKEVQKMFRKLRCNDPSINRFLNAKFTVKMMAKLMAVAENASPQTWSVFNQLKDDKLRQFIPYFIKQIKKETVRLGKAFFPSLPGEITSLLQIMGNMFPPPPEDIKILRFFLEYAPLQQQQMMIPFIQWITKAIMSIQHSLTAFSRGDMFQKKVFENSLKEIFKLMRRLKQIDPNTDISMMCQSFIDIKLFCEMSLIPLNIHFQYFVNSWPEQLLQMISMNFQKGWNFDLFLIVLSLLGHPEVPLFRRCVFDYVFENSKGLLAFFNNSFAKQDLQREIMLSRALDCLCDIVNTLEYGQFDLRQVLKITQKMLEDFVQTSALPSLMVKYIQILLPLRFASQINEDQNLFAFYKDNIMSFFIKRPASTKYFQYPLFNRRLIEFMKLIDENHRKMLYSLLPTPEKSKCILINQLLCDMYKNFPEEAHITVDFSNYVKTPSFPVLILNFSAALLASQKCVEVKDLNNTPILTMNSYTHALAIHYNLRGVDSIKSLTRFFPIIKMLASFDSRPDGLQTALAEKLDVMPYMLKSSLLCFRTLGQQNCMIDHTSRAITQFILGFSTTMLTSESTVKVLDKQFVFVMPHVFRQLSNVKLACQRVFELLLSTVVMVLTRMPDSTAMAQLIPSTMEQFLPLIDKQLVDQNLLATLKKKLGERLPSDVSNQTRTKFLLQLLPVMAPLLFSPTSGFFPYSLQPGDAIGYTKEITASYQRALREAVLVGGYYISHRILKEMYEYLPKIMNNNNSISKPMMNPFATIALWINEVSNDPKLAEMLKVLLDVLKPVTSSDLLIELSSLQQPLHPIVSNFVLDMLENEFITPIFSSIPAIRPLTVKPSIDIIGDCWRMDWLSISVESHITAFSRLILPEDMRSIIPFFTESEMKSILTIILNTNQVVSGEFTRFMNYYILKFPRSSLAECFTMTTTYSKQPPLPLLPLYSNISFFESYNLSEDAFGLLKDSSEKFLNSCSFHQISQFRAAKYHYLRAMSDEKSMYFFGLSELRSIDINLSLTTNPSLMNKILRHRKENSFPVITLPFIQDTQTKYDNYQNQNTTVNNKLTSYISRSHIPFLLHSSLDDEVYQSLKMMQQPENIKNYIDDLARITNVMWIKSLDRQMMMASNFIWRLTILNDFLTSSDIQSDQVQQKIRESIILNKNMIVHILSQSGSTRDALKQIEQMNEIISGPRNISVSLQNYPRVHEFLEKTSSNLKDRTELEKFLNLKSSCSMLMKDFVNVQPKGNRWLKMLFQMFIRFNENIDQATCFQRLLQDLSQSNIFDAQLYIAMLLCMLKKNPNLMNILSSSFGQLKEDVRLSLQRYLPQLINCCPIQTSTGTSSGLPTELLDGLIHANPGIFVITFDDMVFSHSVTDENYVRNLKNELDNNNYLRNHKLIKEDRTISDYRVGMSWIKQCAKDIEKLDRSVKAHKLLYEAIARTSSKADKISIDDRLNELDFLSLDELFLFCEHNPPIFITDVEITKYTSFTGFKFPSSQFVLDIFMEADGTGEAEMRFITMKGDSKTLHIVSPEVYGLNQRERLFVEAVGRIIDKHVSSRTRSRCTYYPHSFQVHEKLMAIDSHSFSSLHGAIQPFSAIERVYQAAVKNNHQQKQNQTKQQQQQQQQNSNLNAANKFKFNSNVNTISENKDSSDKSVNKKDEDDDKDDIDPPIAYAMKKQVNLPEDRLFWWFVQGAEGSQIDFIFMRQSFASYFAVFSYLHFIFRSQLPTLPSIMLFKDRQKVCIPDFFANVPPTVRYLMSTNQIEGFLPPFVMRGTFASSWQITADSLYAHKERLKIILMALVPPEPLPQQQQQQQQQQNLQQNLIPQNFQQQQQNMQQMQQILQQKQKLQQRMQPHAQKKPHSIFAAAARIDKTSAIHMTEETEKCDDVFPFMLMEHLIKNSSNVLMAQPIGFAWV